MTAQEPQRGHVREKRIRVRVTEGKGRMVSGWPRLSGIRGPGRRQQVSYSIPKAALVPAAEYHRISYMFVIEGSAGADAPAPPKVIVGGHAGGEEHRNGERRDTRRHSATLQRK